MFWKLSRILKDNRKTLSDFHVNGGMLKTGSEKVNALANVFVYSHSITLIQ